MALHKILSRFNDGRERYFPGEVREFEETPTAFAEAGWVFVEGITPAENVPADVELDIHGGTLGQAAEGAEVKNG